MKCVEFELKTLFGALKHQWKFMLIIVLVFALIGVGAGALFADRGVGEAAGEAEALPLVDYSKIHMNRNHYAYCRNHLEDTYKTAVAYQEEFAKLVSLTEEQQKSFDGISKKLDIFNEDVLSVIKQRFSADDAVYIPEAYFDEYMQRCQYLLDSGRQALKISEVAAEMLASMDAPALQTDSIAKNYELIISAAASGLEHMRSVQLYETQLKTMQDKDAVLQAEVQMKQWLADAAKELNDIITEINSEADAIAQENSLLFNMKMGAEDAPEFTLGHTHTVSSRQESFTLMVLFCVLTGICVSVFFGLYKECRKQKKLQAE